MIALVAAIGIPVLHPASVFAASGTVSEDTPLYDSPDPAAPAIALLPEGAIVSIDGPPVDRFYPVTAGDRSGWMPGETLQFEKDLPESDPAEEMTVDAPLDQTDETVPVDASADFDSALSTTVEPAPDSTVDTPGAMEASAPGPVDTDAGADSPAIADDIAAEPAAADGAVPADASAIPVAAVALVGSASVAVDAPILAGPGPDYGFITTAPAGSTVEQTGHVISGYATVQYAELTGWIALDDLGAPGTLVDQSPTTETAPVETPLADDPAADTSLTETTASDNTPQAETALREAPPVETSPEVTVPTELAPVDAASVEVAQVGSIPAT
jgi:uncharacterized protein YraI